ncbi:MAG: YcbK family protein [Gammaproteobacteria bacterium]
MLKHNVENDGERQENVELARRGFLGRLALGTVLSIAMPGIVHAAKSAVVKEDKKNRLTKSAGSAARLPKYKAVKSVNQKKDAMRVSSSDRQSMHKARVRDVYAGKNTRTKAEHVSRSQSSSRASSIVRPVHRPVLPEPRVTAHVADRGRLATHRDLMFQNPHTGEKLNLTYFERGRYLVDALDEINYLLRDHRTGDIHPVDPELLDQLHDLKQMLGLAQPFAVVCGYRSPLTNAKLHAEHRGVANNSFHMYGRAVDIRIERFDLRRIHNAAIAMHRGGVGYYPESNFIHLDTGTFRTWAL